MTKARTVPLGYDDSIGGSYSWNLNPPNMYIDHQTLVDATGITDGTVVYPSAGIDFKGYKYGGFQIELTCTSGTVTLTVEASWQDDDTDGASVEYRDVTNELFGISSLVASAGTVTEELIIDTPFTPRFIRIKIVYNTGGNNGGATVYWRGTY
jgi:hypothetical protein